MVIWAGQYSSTRDIWHRVGGEAGARLWTEAEFCWKGTIVKILRLLQNLVELAETDWIWVEFNLWIELWVRCFIFRQTPYFEVWMGSNNKMIVLVQRMMFSPNSAASKARTKALNRTRLSNQVRLWLHLCLIQSYEICLLNDEHTPWGILPHGQILSSHIALAVMAACTTFVKFSERD